MQKKINGGGRPGPWPMDGVSVGVEPDEFAQEEDFMPIYHYMLHPGKSLVMAGIAGGMFAVLSFVVLKVINAYSARGAPVVSWLECLATHALDPNPPPPPPPPPPHPHPHPYAHCHFHHPHGDGYVKEGLGVPL